VAHAVALWIAADGFPGWHLLAVFVLGTVLMRSAGCCVNDVADREFDRHVKRTAQRPVTSGALRCAEALALGAVLALLAFLLVLTTNPPTILLSVRRRWRSRWPTPTPSAAVDAAGGAGRGLQLRHPDGLCRRAGRQRLVSLAAIAAAVPPQAWWLLLGNLFWVLAYDTEYAMVDRDDDLRIGMKTSAITLGRFDVAGGDGFYAPTWSAGPGWAARWAWAACSCSAWPPPRRRRPGTTR
jgi:4-hydroxybenzoate polyprenyltransferase